LLLFGKGLGKTYEDGDDREKAREADIGEVEVFFGPRFVKVYIFCFGGDKPRGFVAYGRFWYTSICMTNVLGHTTAVHYAA
jgi:hypothetical protein